MNQIVNDFKTFISNISTKNPNKDSKVAKKYITKEFPKYKKEC